ncbi:hypothetical protein BABINDRAFT_163533 [Babjeviella inositovora NRRL Y-12698]|uniref:Major facilitator superfamily (MFS) profile domain-containing protein n=1 Tax=Babjeviella inositovora NRRL Y-12698 TaxID=984486 RepID=A0A1E3QIL5_9ASCO|nr:uncharacterized protein BABINDRAFT_163533 [Babjeviella inositovora NRRL Y-12698]ODQ77535.1 hypothetical protein BABINDRAFT_163533 [Babjeviella inositovora NRRL Y-12698]
MTVQRDPLPRCDEETRDELLESAAVEGFGVLFEGPSKHTASEAIVDDDEEENMRWLREARLEHLKLLWHKRPSIGMIVAIMFTLALAVGIGMSAKLVLMLRLACSSIDKVRGDSALVAEKCTNADAQEMISTLQLYCLFIGGSASILVSGKIGEYSDKFGRKPALLFFLCLLVMLTLLTAYLLDPRFQSELHFKLFVLVDLLGKLGGGAFAFLALACLYVTDVVDTEVRTKLLGIVLAAMFLGISIGPIFGSFILNDVLGREDDIILTCYTECMLLAIVTVVVLLVVPESRPLKARQKSRTLSMQAKLHRKRSSISVRSGIETCSPVTHKLLSGVNWHEVLYQLNVFLPLKVFWVPANVSGRLSVPWTKRYEARITVCLLLGVELLLLVSAFSIAPVVSMYGIFQFQWTSTELNAFILISSGARTLSLVLVAPLFINFLKTRVFDIHPEVLDKVDLTVVGAAILFEIGGGSMMTFAAVTKVFLLSSVFMAIGAMASPALQSSIVKYGPKHKTGEVFGALAVFRNMISLVGPASFLYVYRRTVANNPHFVFYLMLLFYVASGVLFVVLAWHVFTGNLSNPNDEDTERTALLSRRSSVSFSERIEQA